MVEHGDIVTRCQDLGSLSACILDAAERSRSNQIPGTLRVFKRGSVLSGGKFTELSWAEVSDRAKAIAADLAEGGVEKGSHVAVLANTSLEMICAIQAIWLCGAVVVIIPLPYRLSTRERFIEDTRARLKDSDSTHLLIDSEISRVAKPKRLSEGLELTTFSLGGLGKSADGASFKVVEVAPEDLAILQFTSGSTSAPKGVMLSHKNLCANMDAITVGGLIDPVEDVFVSWLPLHHDMGLIGKLTYCMTHGVSLVKSSPADFLAKPSRWMEWISEFGGTATAGPNFSYALAARALNSSKSTLDLSNLRIALNGAEPVSPETVYKFMEAGDKHGMSSGAVFPAFGMAETCIAGAFGPVGAGLRLDHIDALEFEEKHVATEINEGHELARAMVKLGEPVQGLEFRVVGQETKSELANREVGELQIRGSSLTSGYYKDSVATEAVIGSDGWFSTGDLAYMVEGELVICGRIKDVIIVGGRNIYPHDVEKAVEEVPGIRAGNAIAFGVDGDGKESIVVVAETKEKNGYDEMSKAVKEAVVAAVGVPATDVALVGASSLPKTSSGKVQRSKCKQQYLTNVLERV